MMTHRTKRWSRRKLILYSVITIFFIAILLELIFRVQFYFKYQNLHTNISIQGNTLQIPDSLLVFKNQPFYVDYNKAYQNNEEGMKSAVGDVFIGNKTINDYWVLLTGGSAMEGMGSNKNGKWLDISGVNDHPYNETIAFYLQELLQKQMPEKKVKVFNAANSSFTIYQSYWRYMSLADKIKPDFVISMDGVNEPPQLHQNETVRDVLVKDWATYPQFHFPIKYIVPFTRHSTFVNELKQKLFHVKLDFRLKRARENNYPERRKWADSVTPPIQWAAFTDDIQRANYSFDSWINKYDSILTARHTKHLLLIQPHISFRDTIHLCQAEKALFHYYESTFQNSNLHSFLRILYNQFSLKESSSPIFTMTSVHHWEGWVFVDYCHFTDDATKKIAGEIFNYIISNGTRKPFQ